MESSALERNESCAGRPEGSVARGWAVWVGFATAGVVATALAWFAMGWWFQTPQTPEPLTADGVEEIEDRVVHNPGYVGADVCAGCHAARVEKFKGTSHCRACRVPHGGD